MPFTVYPVYAAEGGTSPAMPPSPPSPPPSVTAPWSANDVWKLGDSNNAQPWWTTIPEPEVRAHIEAKQYANPAVLAMANYNLTKIQREGIVVPGKDAPPEAWNELYTKLGRPEKPDAYEFKFGPDIKPDETMVKFGKELFYELGVPATKAQAAADKWNKFVAEQQAATTARQQEANQQELDALAAGWGADLEKNKAAGRQALQSLKLSKQTIQRLEQNIGSAAVVELLAALGRKSDEGGFIGAGPPQYDANNPETMTKEQAAQRIAQLQGDKDFEAKYTDRKHPENRNAVQLMERLFAKAG